MIDNTIVDVMDVIFDPEKPFYDYKSFDDYENDMENFTFDNVFKS